jgi:glycosyltransferase involved in cell wall biosynthesis
MHVLQICHSYYAPFLDCARQYAVLFNDTQYKVTTVYLQGDFSQEVVEGSASDEVIFLGYKSSQIGGLKLGAISKIKSIVANKQFEFCITHRVKPTYVALLATKLPIISVHHNYNDYSKWSRRLLVNFYKDRILMLGVSNSVRDDLRRDLKAWPEDKIQTLYNRIDVAATQAQMLNKNAARIALNLSNDIFIIGNVGRLHHDKDQTTLIKAFAKAKSKLPANSLLVIIGAGPLEQDLKNLVASLNLGQQVIFKGNVPNAKQYFKAFDLFVLTSDNEPFGMVLLEALAAELPIICSDCGGGAEVVKDVGDLFVFGNVNDLNNRLVEFQKKDVSTKEGLQKLHDMFSDLAAKATFWSLTQIKNNFELSKNNLVKTIIR